MMPVACLHGTIKRVSLHILHGIVFISFFYYKNKSSSNLREAPNLPWTRRKEGGLWRTEVLSFSGEDSISSHFSSNGEN
jgi:hypothetical protein